MNRRSVSVERSNPNHSEGLIRTEHSFHRDFRHLAVWKDTLVCCTSDAPPSRLEAPVTKLCTITSNLTHLQKKAFTRRWKNFRSYYTAQYTLCIGVQNSNLAFTLEFQGQQYGSASVEFD